ncbi:hypothetical protein FF36_01073 [Frankia torreyi]|uniref:Tetratricopeptide repeat protein n=1 Tax=Frankia torreyi TaxID=1856 RepID=A0A0D8BL35_9ACTN|nr:MULTISPECIES: hypothetical protein [Frankia]KJE24699.1 hypothetical protein FF36_01073 [Frankia torreyi]KQC37524.1 hypothetical protein UK82_14510 [Frankia sp. ACN1ag]KQM07596.1 hypothetical protein FF86_100284 [Frankia sp. CpI1-P]
MRARATVAVLVAACLFYLGLIGWRGVVLLGDDRWAARGLGAGVLLLPVVGVVVIARELQFGRESGRLTRLLAVGTEVGPGIAGEIGTEAGEPVLVRRPSGRIDRASADAVFARRRAEVEADPGDWRRWYRLAVSYGDAGDTRRGRAAMRHAIALERDPR